MGNKSIKYLVSAVMALTAVAGSLPAAPAGIFSTVKASADDTLSDEGFEYTINSDGTVMITGCDWNMSGDVVIPSELGGRTVSALDEGAFNSRTNITRLTVPDNVNLGLFSLAFMTGLKELVIGDNCTASSYLFYFDDEWTTRLEKITVGKNCKIPANAFVDLDTLTTLRAGDGTVFDKNAFTGCGNLSLFTFTGTVVYNGKTYVDYSNEPQQEDPGSPDPVGSFVSAKIESVPCTKDHAIRCNTFDRPSGRKYPYTSGYSKKGLYDGGYWSPDMLQVVTDSKGNNYAAYGYFDNKNDHTQYASYNLYTYAGWMVLKPEDSSKQELVIEKDGWSFGAAAIDEKDCLYVLWGRLLTDDELNTASDDHTVNLVLEKYDLNGKLLASHSFDCNSSTGTNSRYPFDAGNAQIAFNNGVICVTFNTEWHSGHQGIELFLLNQSDLSAKEIMKRDNMGSHCFGHSTIATSDGFAVIQSGDCFPRSLNFTSLSVASPSSYSFRNLKTDWFTCPGLYSLTAGVTGDNNPNYANFGGIAESSSTYALAGYGTREYSANYFKDKAADAAFDEFIQIKTKDSRSTGVGTSRKDMDTGEVVDTDIIWLTDSSDTGILPGVSKVVTLGNGSYCVLWEEFKDERFDATYFEILDEKGNIVTDKTKIEGARLPDNTVSPIVEGSTLKWACADKKNNEIDWYTVDVDDMSVTSVSGATLSLGGDIGVNFYVTPGSDADSAVLQGPNGTVTYKFSSLTPDVQGRYCLSYYVNSTQMKENITLSVIGSKGEQVNLYTSGGSRIEEGKVTYSVKKYVDTINNSSSSSASLAELVNALYSYGAYAAQMLKDAPLPTGAELPSAYAKLTADSLAEYAVVKNSKALPDGMTLYGMTLVADSTTSVRLYFSAAQLGSTAFKVNGKTVTPTSVGNNVYMLEVNDVYAYDLDTAFTFTIGSATFKFSALTYARNVLDMSSSTNGQKDFARALYRYSAAANSYFGK